MSVTQKVTLYNNKFTVPPVINAVQNDTDRQVEAYFGDFTLQVGMTGKLSFIRSDGTHYEVSATLSTANNTATAELDQALTQAGVTQAQLKITDSGNVGSTFTFMIKVQPDVAGISVPQDGWSAQEFDQRLTDAENAIDAVEEDVEDLLEKKYDYAPVITDTASGAIASFPDGADGYPLKECVIQIEAVQSGSGDPAPDNIRPITGFSDAKVTRCGKNLLPIGGWEVGQYNPDIFEVDDKRQTSPFIPISPNTDYTMTIDLQDDDDLAWINYNYFDANRNRLGNRTTNGQSAFAGQKTVTFNIGNTNARYIRLSVRAYSSATKVISGIDMSTVEKQLEVGSTATAQEPCGATYTIDLGSTRYGGVLDVTKGKLKVDRVYKQYTGGWSISNGGTLYIDDSMLDANLTDPSAYMISNQYGVYGGIFIGSADMAQSRPMQICKQVISGRGLRIAVYDSNYTTASAFNTYLESNPLQVVYALATPVEYDLTPTEITTLLGINNVWTDCGDIEVEYCADTKRYIQKLISQLA